MRILALLVATTSALVCACSDSAGGLDASDLVVELAVTGPGAVASDPAGIDCPAACRATFPPGTEVLLQVRPAAGAHLVTWGGDCAMARVSASVRLSESASCTADFDQSRTAWAHAYGGVGTEIAQGVAATPDGGFVVVGSESSFAIGERDLWVMKLDGDGQAAWQKSFGGAGDDQGFSVVALADGGSLVAGIDGSTNGDFWLLRLDGGGSPLWQKTYGGADYDMANSVVPTPDGGFLVGGQTYSFGAGDRDAWMLRLDASGNILWQNAYGGSGMDWVVSVDNAPTGFIAAGSAKSWGTGNADVWVLKLDDAGLVEWQETFGTDAFDYALTVKAIAGGGFMVGGWTSSYSPDVTDAWLLALNLDGSVNWQKLYRGIDVDQFDAVYEVDQGFIAVGTTWSWSFGGKEFWILGLDKLGNIFWEKAYGGGNWEWAHAAAQANNQGIVAAGFSMYFGAGDADFWVLRAAATGDLDASCTGLQTMSTTATVTATPAAPQSVAGLVTPTLAVPVDVAVVGVDSMAQHAAQCPN